MLLLDEWVYLVNGLRLIEDEQMRILYKKYVKITLECNEKGDLKTCESLCRIFNLNKKTPMYDGEY